MLVGLLWVVAFLNAADRSIIVAVMPSIRDEFGLGNTALALLNSLFFWIYAIAAFVSGRIGDSVQRTRIILYGLVFWSIATGLTGLSTGFVMLLACRGLVALGEATYYPTATALISDWHVPRWRSRALSLHQTGVFAGAGLGAWFAGYLADRISWHAPFVVFAAAGLVHAAVLRRWLRAAPAPTAREVGEEPLGVIWRIKPAVMLCVVFCLGTGAATGVTVWAPTYVHDALGLDLAGSALVGSATISTAGFLAVPLGGWLGDTLTRRSAVGRFQVLVIGLALAALLLLPLAFVKTAGGVALVLVLTTCGKGLFDGCIYAAMHDVVPAHARGTAVGAMTMIGFFGAGVTPLLVAWLSGSFGMAAGMTSLAGFYIVAVGLMLAMRGPIARAVAANAGETH